MHLCDSVSLRKQQNKTGRLPPPDFLFSQSAFDVLSAYQSFLHILPASSPYMGSWKLQCKGDRWNLSISHEFVGCEMFMISQLQTIA